MIDEILLYLPSWLCGVEFGLKEEKGLNQQANLDNDGELES